MELTLVILSREYEIVFAVFINAVRCPHLILNPRNVVFGKSESVVDAFGIQAVHGKHMVILHNILIAVVIVRAVMREVMGRVDVNLAVEHVRRRVSRENAGDKRLSFIGSCQFDLLHIVSFPYFYSTD